MSNSLNIKAKAYWLCRHLFSLLNLAVAFIFLSLAQFTGISSVVADLARRVSGNFYIGFFIYLVIINTPLYLINLPLDYIKNYSMEHRFLLSNQTRAGWAKDELKGAFLSGLIGLVLTETFYSIGRIFQDEWWIVSSAVSVLVSVIFARLFPVFIIPLFYKYKKISNIELRQRILSLADKCGVKFMDVFEIDFSKNTKKSNAAITGWGKTRRIILADNLINEFSIGEIEAVLAHELAHYKLRHIWLLLLAGALSNLTFFFLLKIALRHAVERMGFQGAFDMALFPFVALSFMIYGLLYSPLANALSRRLETDADKMAIKLTGNKEDFISLMRKLGEKNLSYLDPNLLVEILFYDHPPIAKRIRLAE